MSDSFGPVTAHPYMANSVPEIKREMLDAIGVESVEELFEQIPQEHRLKTALQLPPALTATCIVFLQSASPAGSATSMANQATALTTARPAPMLKAACH